jgi:hypothetical protein
VDAASSGGDRGMRMLKRVVIGVVAVVAVALVILWIVAPEPANVPGTVVVAHKLNIFVRPAFWQRGEVVRTPVTDWSFIRKSGSAVLETRTPWLIPHSIRMVPRVYNNQLYIPSAQYRMEKGFPDRLWTWNVWRDPRVRMKVGDKIYELTMVLVTDRKEAEAVWGRNMEYWSNEGGKEQLVGYQHLYRAFQRNIPEYGEFTKPRDFSGLPGSRRPTPPPAGTSGATRPPASTP